MARTNRLSRRLLVSCMNLHEGAIALPERWPKTFGLVLDRLCINNVDLVGDDDEAIGDKEERTRRIYFCRLAELVVPGGIAVVCDRESDDIRPSSFWKRMFEAVDTEDFLDSDVASRYFAPVPGGRILNVRLVGDDTRDLFNFDHMVPVLGRLAVLRRKRVRA